MLVLNVLRSESYDSSKKEFVDEFDVIELEHSLVSLSKWEENHEKPFLSDVEKTTDEVIDYVRLMILTPDCPPDILTRLSPENYTEIMEYINAKRTATWFNDPPGPTKKSVETITSELIYYWMVALTIPFQPAETWHLNRLFTLIRIANVKNAKPTPKSKAELAAQRREMNAQRRKQLGTQG